MFDGVVPPPETTFPWFLGMALTPTHGGSSSCLRRRCASLGMSQTFLFQKILLCGLGQLEGRNCVSLAFVPARPAPALPSGYQEMIAREEWRTGKKGDFLVLGDDRCPVMVLFNRDDFYWFLSFVFKKFRLY